MADSFAGVIPPDRIVRTVCSPNCSGTCGMNVFVKDDRILKVEPAAFPIEGFERICLKGISMAMQRLHHPDRLRFPLRRAGDRGADKWRRVTWEEAYEDIAARLGAIADRHGSRAAAWISMTGNYGFKAYTSATRAANCLGGTVLTNAGLMSDFAGFAEVLSSLGAPMSNEISDIAKAKTIMLVGRNVADTAHSEMHFIFDALEDGAKLVVVDPRFSRTAAKADVWLAPRPGTDAALALGMINALLETDNIAHDYLAAYTNAPFLVRSDNQRLLRGGDLGWTDEAAFVVLTPSGALAPASRTIDASLSGATEVQLKDGAAVMCRTAFDAMRAAWAAYTPERAASICDVPANQIRGAAHLYAQQGPSWIWLGEGPQRYYHGQLAYRGWITLAALCGNIGKPYAGVNVIDGAHLMLLLNQPDEWTAPGGARGSVLPGVKMLDAIARDDPYPVRSLWIATYNFATQSPYFKRFIDEALPKLELFVVNEQVMTDTARYADYVLPVISYFEDDMDLVGGGETWFLQLRRRAVSPIGDSKSDYEIFAGLCEKMGRGEHWRMSPEEICRFILAHHKHPGIRSVDWTALKRDGVVLVDQGRPRTPFEDKVFPTPSQRLELYQEALIDSRQHILVHEEPLESHRTPGAARFPLVLITYKHVHSAHSTHLDLPWIREVLPEPLLEMNPGDAESRGLNDGDFVRVWNERGAFVVKMSVTNAVQKGVVALPQGWSKRRFESGHPSDLGHIQPNAVQERVLGEANYPVWDVLVEVKKQVAHA